MEKDLTTPETSRPPMEPLRMQVATARPLITKAARKVEAKARGTAGRNGIHGMQVQAAAASPLAKVEQQMEARADPKAAKAGLVARAMEQNHSREDLPKETGE